MKSNQLNAIALLLLATAGLSATVTQYDAVQKALDIVRTGKGSLTQEESNAIGDNIWTVANRIELAKDKTSYINPTLAIANAKATFVQRNKARALRNIVDPIVRNKSKILKAAAAVVAVGATAYAVDRYGFEGKGLKYTQESASKGLKATKEAASNVYAKGQGYASWLYSKLPAKPTWLAMPTFISKLFAKKEVEAPKSEKEQEANKQPETTLEKAANFVANGVQSAKQLKEQVIAKKTKAQEDYIAKKNAQQAKRNKELLASAEKDAV